jgi:gas vesicle protein
LWPEVSVWLTERAAADIVATFAALRDRIAGIATRVAERFDAETGAGDPIDGAALDDLVRRVLASLPTEAALTNESGSRLSSGLNAFRSTFYAFSMFSTVGALVGAVAVAPAALVLGLAVGGKAMRDERAKSRQQRRAHAKVAVRTYLDEVAFVAGKETRDALRTMQRALRDHFTALAAEQQRSHAEAVAAARRAAEVDGAARSRRLADVEAELGRLDILAGRAAALAAATGAGGAR